MSLIKQSRAATAFTLVEMLVVVGLIALLLGILLPVVAGSQNSAGQAICIQNLQQISASFEMYLKDYRDNFPAGSPVPNHRTLIGGEGFEDGAGAGAADNYSGWDTEDRPLGKYLASAEVAHCPRDRGQAFTSAAPEPAVNDVFKWCGSSYLYLNRDFTNPSSQFQVNCGILAVEGHRRSQFNFPERKVLTFDNPIQFDYRDSANSLSVLRLASDGRNQWHNPSEPLQGGAAFLDGHAEVVKRKINTSVPKNATTGLTLTDIRKLEGESYY